MLWLVAAFASLAGFLFGYDLGLIGGALLNIKDAFGLGDWAAEAIVAAAKWGAVPGTFLGGALMLHYGRRRAIAIDSLFFIAGPLIMALSWGVGGLVVGRVVVGLGIGVSAAVVPAYLGEVAPARVRGRVVESYELLLCVGMLAAALGDAAFQGLPANWRWMVGAPVVPAALLSLSLCLLPESPRWLVIRGRLDEALAVIHAMYQGEHLPPGMQRSTADVEHELLQLWSSVEKDRDATTALRQQHAERQRRRQERRAAKLAPLSSSPLGLGGDGGGGDKGGWRRLGAADEEGGDGEAPEAVSGAGEAAAVEAGAAGVHRRMQQAAQAQGEGSTAAGGAQDEQHSLLRSASGGAAGASSSGPQPASPLKVPPHLPRIRTSSSQNLAQLGQQQPAVQALEVQAGAGVQRSGSGALRAPLQAVSSDSGGAYQAGEWGTRTRSGSQQLERLASSRQQQRGEDEDEDEERPGAGGERPEGSAGAALDGPSPREPSFWATFREMVADIYLVATGPEGNALQMALWLAFFNQAFASTSIISYAPQVLERAGVESHTAAALLTSAVGGSKMLGVLLSFFLVDSLGRRPLLVWGSAGCAAALAGLALADWLALRAFLVAAMCAFIFAFSVSWAGVFWVLLSELFSMSAKSPAASAATAVLFATGALADTLFLSLHGWLGPFAFLLYAALAAVAGLFVAAVVPETRGKTLQEVQALLALRAAPGSAPRRGWWPWRRPAAQQERRTLLPAGAALSDGAG